MSKSGATAKIKIKDELYEQYNWFYWSFLPTLQLACNEFFSELFTLQLTSISKNINVLFQGDDYFVTKVRIDKQHDVFFRCSECAIQIILDEILGPTEKRFELTNITELEAKIISSFNDYLYSSISPILLQPSQTDKKRTNLDMIHLTFFIKDNESHEGGKFILSVPQVLLSPALVKSSEEKFDVSDFKSSQVEVSIKVGTTKFPVKDLKLLEKEDIVVFENSNIQQMELIFGSYRKDFRITPNPGLIISLDNNDGGNNMENNSLSQNLWDTIQVEMGAEFDKVKITLGELKNIEQGLVLDISSVYNNRISLKVENKTIAKGELVIINDRYGVRIDEVFASEAAQAQEAPQQHVEQTEEAAPPPPVQEEASEEEFDYSDFELDDEDI